MTQFKEIKKEVEDSIKSLFGDTQNGELKYKGVFMSTVSLNNGSGIKFLLDKHLLSKEDKKKVKEWVHSNRKVKFRDDFYKMHLDKHIIIFKEYNYPDEQIILMGQFYEKSPVVRMMMLESQQQYLQEQLI